MTRKPRPRKEENKLSKKGYCDMCNSEYIDVMVHSRSPHHLAFVRESQNFRSLDSLIRAEADVSALLDKIPVNGERRSLRKLCNGDSEHEPTTNGGYSPRVNGVYETRKPRGGRCHKSNGDASHVLDDRQYYKVIGVNTKLRSSGAFCTQQRDSQSPPHCNGDSAGLVVKFKKVRRSELSVLSDEAEQFMFPRRASTSSSEDEEEEIQPTVERRRSLRPSVKENSIEPSVHSERRRSARPTALKEESSEDDSLFDHRQIKRKRGCPRKLKVKIPEPETKVELPTPVISPAAEIVPEVQTPHEEVKERCLKWIDGRLIATPAVEELQFSFESVPKNEPWYDAFHRQDNNKPLPRNVRKIFALYHTTTPKLPYELGQLPPLKPNCCHLSDLVKREDTIAGLSRTYGTRGNKKQKFRKGTPTTNLIALEKHPRKSPREHASTLAILGGLLHRRRHNDDTKSTVSEDTYSETNSNTKVEMVQEEPQEQSERLQQFLSEVFEDMGEYDLSDDAMEGEATVVTSSVPDVIDLVNNCDDCDIIRNEVKEGVATRTMVPSRRGYKFKKKNRTGWPNKKKPSATRIANLETSKCGLDMTTFEESSANELNNEIYDSTVASMEDALKVGKTFLRKVVCTETEGSAEDGSSEAGWGAAALQPVVRVTKMDSVVTRRLRSATAVATRGGRKRRGRAYRFR